MNRRSLILILISLVSLLLFVSSQLSDNGSKVVKNNLEQLQSMGITSRYLDDTTIELSQEWSGFKRVKTLQEPEERTIRAWANARSIPMLEIDPDTIDTIRYNAWQKYWTRVPLSNGFGAPLIVGDVDQNGKPEIYGGFKDFWTDYESRVYEIDSTGSSTLLYNYIPRMGAALELIDVDNNGLKEIVFRLGDSSFFFEQDSIHGIPIHRKFAYTKFEIPRTAIWSNEVFAHLDNDTRLDYLYRGSAEDSVGTHLIYTSIAEYDTTSNQFKKIWSNQLKPNGGSAVGGYDAGDYDGDGKMEFVASGAQGQVWVIENTGDNRYEQIWKDSIPFVNMYYQTSGDVDNDGKREFFVGATMSNGNWITVYEADSNNHYSSTFLFHLMGAGAMAEPIYMTRDIDRDGKEELMFGNGAILFVFKSDQDNTYRLAYYHREGIGEGYQFYDFNNDGIQDILLSKTFAVPGAIEMFADIYLGSSVLRVDDGGTLSIPEAISLNQNYPNPFNPTTTLSFVLRHTLFVTLKVYSMLGEEVATLANENLQAGRYERQWNATGLPSGVYFYRLTAGSYSDTRKLILIK